MVKDENGKVLTVRRYSDQLLMFLLKGRRPETFRERTSVELNASINISEMATQLDACLRRRAVNDASEAQAIEGPSV